MVAKTQNIPGSDACQIEKPAENGRQTLEKALASDLEVFTQSSSTRPAMRPYLQLMHHRGRDRYEILRFECFLLNLKRACPPEIYKDIFVGDSPHLPDAIVIRFGPIIHELALIQLTVPGSPVIGMYHREQLQTIWCTGVFHGTNAYDS